VGINPFPQQFPPPQTPLIDKATGAASRDGSYLLLALWSRTGHGDGTPTIGPGLAINDATVVFNITNDWNEFTAVPPGGACQLPQMAVGTDCIIWNDGANSLSVQPQRAAQIDALGAGAGYSLAAGKMQWFRCITPTQIKSMQLG
jgi:hypothetical protein